MYRVSWGPFLVQNKVKVSKLGPPKNYKLSKTNHASSEMLLFAERTMFILKLRIGKKSIPSLGLNGLNLHRLWHLIHFP